MTSENNFGMEAAQQQVLAFVRDFVWRKREGFYDGLTELPDLTEHLENWSDIMGMLTSELHIGASEAREAFNWILFNRPESKFVLPATTVA